MKLEWQYNPVTEAWETGKINDGAGVFYISPEEYAVFKDQKPGWHYNVVNPRSMNFITSDGPFNSKEEAQQKAEELIVQQKEESGDSG